MASPTLLDHTAIALEQLISQWDEKQNIRGLLQSLVVNKQPIEDCLFQILTESGVNDAISTTLDQIGLLVGEDRGARTDDQYRAAIIAKISANVSSGTPEQMMSILQNATLGTKMNIFEHFPASVIMYSNTDPIPALLESMDRAAPAGVNHGQIIFDDYYDETVIPSELSLAQFNLVTDNLDQIVVDTDGGGAPFDDLIVQMEDVLEDPRAELASTADPVGTRPLAALVG